MTFFLQDEFAQTLTAISVNVSQIGHYGNEMCAKNNAKVVRGATVTLPCKTVGRHVTIKRLPGSWKFWSLCLCEVVIIGRRLVCKYCTTLYWHIRLLGAGWYYCKYCSTACASHQTVGLSTVIHIYLYTGTYSHEWIWCSLKISMYLVTSSPP